MSQWEKSLMIKSHVGQLLMVIISICATVLLSSSVIAQRRIRPPDSIKCDYNHLTSFTGRILYYERRPGRVSLRMRTDEATTENFTLRFRKTEDAAKWFLMKGELFKQSDWALIERSRYRLRPRIRATVWVCDDGSKPIIDWRPSDSENQTTF
jgi:hypothetical protein